MITVLANGVFDVLHIGHLWHLEAARTMGDRLIVSITVDEHVNKGDGRPIMQWHERAAIIRALRCVDMVIPTVNAVSAIRTIKPQFFVKGVDYSSDDKWGEDVRAACREVNAQLRFTYTPKIGSRDFVQKAKALP